MTMVIVLGVVVPMVLALAHRLQTADYPPAAAIFFWVGTLGLRAMATLVLASAGLLLAASSTYAQDAAHLLWHTELPATAARTGASGHTVADVTVLLPGLAIGALIAYSVIRSARSAVSLQRVVERTRLGPGPFESVIVAEAAPLVAAVGLFRSQVVVSSSVLEMLDEQELQAAIAHEHAHVSRGHRFLMLFAGLCMTLARWQPGTRTAMRQLCHHMERDADSNAVRSTPDRLALASAICKVAAKAPLQRRQAAHALHGTEGQASVTARVSELLQGPDLVSGMRPKTLLVMTGIGGLIAALVYLWGIEVSRELQISALALVHHPSSG